MTDFAGGRIRPGKLLQPFLLPSFKGFYRFLKRLTSCQNIHARLNQLETVPRRRTSNRAAMPPITLIFDRNELISRSAVATYSTRGRNCSKFRLI